MDMRSLAVVVSTFLVGGVLSSACAAPPPLEAGEDEEEVEPEAVSMIPVRAGAELVTTTRVNFREEPTTKSAVIRVLPAGTAVKVMGGRPTNGFHLVEIDGERGHVFGTYLRPDDDTGEEEEEATSALRTGSGACMDTSAASRIAREARSMDGRGSQSLCYRYVKDHIEDAGFMNRSEIPARFQASAYMFARWARSDPSGFARAGWMRSSSSVSAIPVGAVIVWRPGQCGYSSRHGHIEIAIGGGRACSDFCGRIKTGCGAPEVFVPRKSSCE